MRPENANNPNAFVADDHYNRMESDIAYLGSLKATAYRFSISWPRILPNCSGEINQAGIDFYNRMINEIIKNGATPVLTMYHWDTPQACHDQYGSWTNIKIVEDFTNYADVILKNFGDRLEYILTINEPSAECGWGYAQNVWPPGANLGESAKYICQHYTNLAHGSVVKMARRKYPDRNFKFGMPLIVGWSEPLTNTEADIQAANRTMIFHSDWNWGPLVNGDYSDLLKNDRVWGPLLPQYTEEQKEMMRGTMDFVALNYYSASYAYASSDGDAVGGAKSGLTRDGQLIGPVSGTHWQNIYAPGIRKIAQWMYNHWKMDIFIVECGTSVPNEQTMTRASDIANDGFRVDFFEQHTQHLADAVLIDKTPIKAFLAWSLMDNFEWRTYDQRFGVIAVDYHNGTLDRTVKQSAYFLRDYFSNAVSPLALPSLASNSTNNNSNNTNASNETASGNTGGSSKNSSEKAHVLSLMMMMSVACVMMLF